MDAFTSIWEATAPPAPATPALDASTEADVAVIGAGFTGLAAALRLAEGGARVVVLDAAEPCDGASGRNGGQVIPGLKYDPDKIAAVFGDAAVDFAGGAADGVFGLIGRLGIACEAEQAGWIQPSVKEAHLPVLHGRAEQWARRGAKVEPLDREALRSLTGSTAFVGGWIDRRAGKLHPLKYAHGLLAAAQATGARVHGHSRVTGLDRQGRRWTLTTAGGARVSAEAVFVATNGYTDGLVPRLKETIVPATSYQIATEPLPPDLAARILPTGAVVSDSRRIANYFRVGPGGRLMIGGRGGFAGPQVPEDFAFLARSLRAFYPEAAALPVAYRWFGRLAVTRDFLPHLHEPRPGLVAALGYSGRGIAMATAIGTAVGAHLLDRSNPLPLRASPIRPMPLHRFHRQYAALTIRYMALRDALER